MKKYFFLFIFLISCNSVFSQSAKDCAAIDARSKSIGYLPLQELTSELIAPYSKDEDKVRAIFSWIAYHIAYDYEEYKHRNPKRYDEKKYSKVYHQATFDSLWRREYAQYACQNHKGVCSEYAALFKAMCDDAFIPCEIVNGYGKWYENIGIPFASNHAWNAVCLNNQWQLLDVTWAAGTTNFHNGQFTFNYNNFYYRTPPEFFINDHYPDLIKWTLLPDTVSRVVFQNAIYFNYVDNDRLILSANPSTGFLYRQVGDSIVFEIQTKLKCKINVQLDFGDRRLTYTPDPADAGNNRNSPGSKSKKSKQVTAPQQIPVSEYAALRPHYFKKNGNKVIFTYNIRQRGDFLVWIYMDYNRIMAYRLIVP